MTFKNNAFNIVHINVLSAEQELQTRAMDAKMGQKFGEQSSSLPGSSGMNGVTQIAVAFFNAILLKTSLRIQLWGSFVTCKKVKHIIGIFDSLSISFLHLSLDPHF